MNNHLKKCLLLSLVIFFTAQLNHLLAQRNNQTYRLRSPDKQTLLEFTDNNGELVYRAAYNGKNILNWSSLGLELENGNEIGREVTIDHIDTSSYNNTFAWRLGDRDSVVNHYHQMTISCESKAAHFDIIARAFNGSIAFRYLLKDLPADSINIINEGTGFNFTKPYTIYQYQQESVFTPVKLDALSKACDFPATLTSNNMYISINEADNVDYTKAVLEKGKEHNSLKVAFVKDIVKASGNYATPWRTLSFSKNLIGLGKYTDLLLRLCPPPANGIPGWVKPGKLIRAKLNTQSGLDCIDFAASHNFQYIMFDAGWYGTEYNSTSDPTTYIKALDIPKIINYGKSKNIGVILYVNYIGLRKYLDQILPLYKKWGVAGIKFGFVNGLKQEGISWVLSAVKKASADGFVIDIHDNYKPTGLSRTYPALLTQEGIRGNEHGPDAFHNTVLPFTRFLSGGADYTFCYPGSDTAFNHYLETQKLNVSKAHQLALTVVFFSPLQSMLWYGEPSYYDNEQDVEFFAKVPTVWDQSIYLKGKIGAYASVARRKGDDWYIGNISGLNPWKDQIKLDFLKPGVNYKATTYEDDGKGHIKKEVREVKKGDIENIDLKARSGKAMILSPGK